MSSIQWVVSECFCDRSSMIMDDSFRHISDYMVTFKLNIARCLSISSFLNAYIVHGAMIDGFFKENWNAITYYKRMLFTLHPLQTDVWINHTDLNLHVTYTFLMQVGSRPSDNIRVFSRAEKPNLELINTYIYIYICIYTSKQSGKASSMNEKHKSIKVHWVAQCLFNRSHWFIVRNVRTKVWNARRLGKKCWSCRSHAS